MKHGEGGHIVSRPALTVVALSVNWTAVAAGRSRFMHDAARMAAVARNSGRLRRMQK